MAIENAQYIDGLNPLYPLINDPISEGDDHIRVIKQVLQNTFPNIDAPFNLDIEQVDKLVFEEKNYDDVIDPATEDLRTPNDIDEAIEWHDKNVEARISGSGFGDGSYDEDQPRPTNPPEDYPNELNLYQLEQRIAAIEELYKLKVGTIYFSANATNPSNDFEDGGLGYGTWSQVGAGQFIAGVGSGTDANGVIHQVALGANAGEYEHTLTEDEMPSHTHTLLGIPGDQVRDTSSGSQKRSAKNTQTTSSSGGDQPHNNILPHLGLYIWQRTA